MPARRAQLALIALWLPVAACDGHHPLRVGPAPDTGAPPAAVPLDDFIVRYLDANCAWLVSCRFWPGVDACATDLWPTYVGALQNTVAAARAGRIHYDPEMALACFAAVRGQACALGASAAACTLVFAGTVAAGQPCVVNNECTSRRCGNYPADAGCCAVGTCLARAPAGAPCSSTDSCADGTYCAGASGAPGTCLPLTREGGPCSTQVDCDPSLRCDRSTGICVAYSPTGTACTPSVSSCDRIAGFCDGASGTCQPWRSPGQPCAAASDDPNGTCVRYAACVGGICVALPGLGESCAVPDGGESSAACRTGTCAEGRCQKSTCPTCTLESAGAG